MAYTINYTDGNVFASIADGTVNTIQSGTVGTALITLVGKNYAGYGEFLDNNFLHLLENGANGTAPPTPVTGQLWWDKTNGLLKAYNGTNFKVISGASSTAGIQPSNPVSGDLWYNSSTQQLNVYTGSGWIVVGPAYTVAKAPPGRFQKLLTTLAQHRTL